MLQLTAYKLSSLRLKTIILKLEVITFVDLLSKKIQAFIKSVKMMFEYIWRGELGIQLHQMAKLLLYMLNAIFLLAQSGPVVRPPVAGPILDC